MMKQLFCLLSFFAFNAANAQLLNLPEAHAMQKLRQYCAACHALGGLRFIYTDDNETLWNDIHTRRSPKSQNLWVEEIRKVLSWPSDSPPPTTQLMQPPDRDWMPKGKKRLDFAADEENGISARRLILDVLSSRN